MGQSASTPNNNSQQNQTQPRPDVSRTRRLSQLFLNADSSSTTTNTTPALPTTATSNNSIDATTPQVTASGIFSPPSSHLSPHTRQQNAYGTFRRRISAQRQSSHPGSDSASDSHEELVYEQEERPLVNMEDLGMRDAPITHIAATPVTRRRQSTMSRLGSRILPDAVARTLLNSGEETEAEGLAHRTGLSDHHHWDDSRTRPTHRRLATFGSTSSRRSSASPASPRRRSIRNSLFLRRDDDDTSGWTDHFDSTRPLRSRGNDDEAAPEPRNPWRRRARLNRVRHSWSLPLPQIFGSRQEANGGPRPRSPRTPLRSHRNWMTTDDADHLLPPLSAMDHRMDLDHTPLHELDANDTETTRSMGFSSASRTPTTASGIRRLPGLSRTRSNRSNRPGEDQPPLSRILQLAATTIAAQLTGQATPPMPNIQAIGAEGLDGTLHSFVQSLQDATAGRATTNAITGDDNANANTNTNGPEGTRANNLPPVNFLRVFRFVNHEPEGPGSASDGLEGSDNTTGPDVHDRTGPLESTANTSGNTTTTTGTNATPTTGRTVTLVVVGVRSVPSGSTSGLGNTDPDHPSLDSLLHLPIMPSTNPLSNLGLRRRADSGNRFAHRRSASGAAVHPFPSNYDSQRHHRTRAPPAFQADVPHPNAASTLTSASGSPSGPNPPPSTPAEPSLTNTPSRRPSSASALPPFLPHLDQHMGIDGSVDALPDTTTTTSTRQARQRRRSDSEFARHRELGSGASRRNGVVEPDQIPGDGEGVGEGDQGRSWLIYVVGTNLSAHHPALATPSLFTEVCPQLLLGRTS